MKFILSFVKSFSDYIINQNAIKHNLNEYRKLDDKSKICAVVKADGYGIGASNVVEAIDDDVDCYAVACFTEAKKLRKLTNKNILVMNTVKKDALQFCASNNISITIFNSEQVEEIIKTNIKGKLKVHLAVNTGMNRIGFSTSNDFICALKIIENHKDKIEIEGIFTHLHNAKSKRDSKKQICIFMQYINTLSIFFDISKIIKHAAASYAAVKYPSYRFDMVRLGILLYGEMDENNSLNLNAVLSIKSRVINVTKIKKGEYVGYGTNYVAKRSLKIATIPLGYADGIMRAFAKRGFVTIFERRCKIIGNICMDMFMVDVSKTDVKNGDVVELIGINQTARHIAQCCGTISYEILTNIKKNRFNLKVLK